MIEKVIAFWRGCSRLLNNPILHREFIVRLRRKSSFQMFLAILVFCLLVSIYVWKAMQNPPSGIDINLFSRNLYLSLILWVGFIFNILILIFTAVSINQEVSGSSWDLLRASPIRLSSILAAKWLAPIGFIALILSSFVPFYWIVMIQSGVSPAEVFGSIVFMFESVFLCGIIGLYASSQFNQPVRSVTLALLICIIVYYFVPVVCARLFVKNLISGSTGSLLEYCLSLFVFISPELVPSLYMGYRSGGLGPVNGAGVAGSFAFHIGFNVLFVTLLLWLTARNIRRKADQGGIQKKRIWKKYIFWGESGENLAISKSLSFPDWCNPVWIKERCELLGRNTYKPYFELIGLIILGTVMTLIFLGLFGAKFDLKNYHRIAFLPVVAAPFLILPYAAGAFRSEMDRNTWEILISSPLSPQTILSGKILAGCYLFLRRFWALFGFWVVLGAVLGHQMVNNDHIKVMIYSVMISHAFCFFTISLCMFFSLLSRKIVAAYVWSFLSIIILLLSPSFIDLIWPSDFLRSIYDVLCPLMIVNASMRNPIGIEKIETVIPWQIGWMLAGSCGLLIFIKNRIPKQIREGNRVV